MDGALTQSRKPTLAIMFMKIKELSGNEGDQPEIVYT